MIRPVLNFALLVAGAVAGVVAGFIGHVPARLCVLLIAASGAATAASVGAMRFLERAPRRETNASWLIMAGRSRFLATFLTALAFAILAVVGTLFHAYLAARIGVLICICLFAIAALILPVGGRLPGLLEIGIAGLAATLAGGAALTSLVLRPRSEVFLLAGCALLIIAAAGAGCLSELNWRERLRQEQAAQADGRG